MRTAYLLPIVLFAATACSQAKASPAADFVTVDAPVIALANVRIIDGTGGPVRDGQTIVIRKGVIADVGDSRTVSTPSEARVIDLRGRTVMPGYVMLHEHLYFTPDGEAGGVATHTFAPLYLAGGATTIRTGGSMSWSSDLKTRELVQNGELPGPEIDLTSPFVERARLPIIEFTSGAERGRKLARKWADRGATSFKAYRSLDREELRGLVEEAHARGLKVTGHLCATSFSEAAELGIDNLEHGLWAASDFVTNREPGVCPDRTYDSVLAADWSAIHELIRKLVARRVAVTSTLAVFETFIPRREPAGEAAQELMTADARERYRRRRAEVAEDPPSGWNRLFEREMAFQRAFVNAGGLLVAGTDPTGRGGLVAGFSNQRQVQLLVEAGFTIVEAISIATINGARYLGREARIGSIGTGKQADLIVVRGNPEARISAIEDVETVFKNGVGYDSRKLKDSVRGLVGVR